MLTGFYTAASGMKVQQRTLNVQANNMANMNTPGFKAERVVSTAFEQQLLTRIEGGKRTVVGKGSPMKLVEDVPTTYDESLVRETLRPYDFAIMGEGYFNIQVGDQVMYTRNGNFDVDEEGFLILRGAGRVLGQRGEIEVGGSNFTVSPEGVIYNDRGRRVDTIAISQPREGVQMDKYANGLYSMDDQRQETDMLLIRNAKVSQGYLESANIDLNREMTMVIETQRAFQSCSSALQLIDQMNQKTANQIASL